MNYYNEHDQKAAAWLRELINQGLIPQGDVDTRSIVDVRPADLTPYTQCHFFAGIGGWPLALQLAGVPATTPLWTGSCPCQPFSTAGKGLAQQDERHLWPIFFDLIRQCRPEHVFGEQVASAIGHGWLDGISADLEAEGYACGAAVLGAHSVQSPHQRQRLYWVADGGGWKRVVFSGDCDEDRNCPECGIDYADCECLGPTQDGVEYEEFNGVLYGRMADSEQSGLEGQSRHGDNWSEPRRINQDTLRPTAESGAVGGLDDAGRPSDERRGESGDVGCPPDQEQGEARQRERSGDANSDSVQDDCGLEQSNGWGLELGAEQHGDTLPNPANRSSRGQHSDGLSGHLRTDNNGMADTNGSGSLDGINGEKGWGPEAVTQYCSNIWSDFSLVHCRDGKTRRIPTEPAFFPLAHGVPARVVRLRGYGNAIVPQVAAAFIQAFYETQQPPHDDWI